LFGIIEELVQWENTTNEEVLEKARVEIRKSWREACEVNKDHPKAAEIFNPDILPGLHDPFAGGGAIPLEAQRLGLEAYASDLNPVAVLINKAMIEIPPKFAGRAPVGPLPEGDNEERLKLGQGGWTGASGLAEDVRRYGKWMRDEAERKIGHLYPKVEITAEMAKDRPDLKCLVGKKLAVIAWLWARTVKSPNPAFNHVDVPLVSSFVLSSNEGKEVYVQPIIDEDKYRFTVKRGVPGGAAKNGTTAGKRAAFRCLMSNVPISYDYIRTEGQAGRLGEVLMAIVTEGESGRVYLPPVVEHEVVARQAQTNWKPDLKLQGKCRVNVSNYGLDAFGDLFTPRQLVALTTFSDLIPEVIKKAQEDALRAGMGNEDRGLDAGEVGAKSYAEALGLYLAFAIDRCADFSNSCTRWVSGNQKVMNLFGKQAVAMTWDFPEAAVLNKTVGGIETAVDFVASCILKLPARLDGFSLQQDARENPLSEGKIVSTDPPYYDNIGYADLSDFFYIWLRRSLRPIFPNLFSTLAVPKAEELVATPFRHGTKEKAETFFLDGMTSAMHRLAKLAHPGFPVTIYYAFKQSETKSDSGTISTGWEAFLNAVIQAGFAITGTWPMRSEQEYRMIGQGTNALASSIVLVCRPRPGDAPSIPRRQFLRELKQVLPEALEDMTKGTEKGPSPVAPVDLSQAIIGPGMAVFSKYSAVLEADGTPMSVGTALRLINGFLVDPELDPDTQFCLHWFEQYGWKEGVFGQADVLARSKGTSVDGIRDSGVLFAEGGTVRLLRENELEAGWDPESDSRIPVWEALHQMIRALKKDGFGGAGKILASPSVLPMADGIRQLAYRLYTLCERAGRAEEAQGYNMIGKSWESIEVEVAKTPAPTQGTLNYQ
jgi:putative DNA methylase